MYLGMNIKKGSRGDMLIAVRIVSLMVLLFLIEIGYSFVCKLAQTPLLCDVRKDKALAMCMFL